MTAGNRWSDRSSLGDCARPNLPIPLASRESPCGRRVTRRRDHDHQPAGRIALNGAAATRAAATRPGYGSLIAGSLTGSARHG